MSFIFPNSWDDDPIWLIFFRGVETTNQKVYPGKPPSFPYLSIAVGRQCFCCTSLDLCLAVQQPGDGSGFRKATKLVRDRWMEVVFDAQHRDLVLQRVLASGSWLALEVLSDAQHPAFPEGEFTWIYHKWESRPTRRYQKIYFFKVSKSNLKPHIKQLWLNIW